VRLVADRTPDRGKRGKDIAILQMGQDAYRKIAKIRNCVTWVTTKLFLHTQVVVARSQVPRPATRSELTRTRYVASWQILLQKSEVATVCIFGENLKRAEIRVASVALPKSPMSLA
jgi:hypothetical protein